MIRKWSASRAANRSALCDNDRLFGKRSARWNVTDERSQSVRERQKEKEREQKYVWVCVCEREREGGKEERGEREDYVYRPTSGDFKGNSGLFCQAPERKLTRACPTSGFRPRVNFARTWRWQRESRAEPSCDSKRTACIRSPPFRKASQLFSSENTHTYIYNSG